jgi:toxin FitB
MADLLVDTDIFIDHLRGYRPLVVGSNRIFYSVVTRAELFAGRNADEEPIRLLLSPFTELPMGRPVAEVAGRLRRDDRISLPDAVIAATALHGDMALVTRNIREFASIGGLRVRSPERSGR